MSTFISFLYRASKKEQQIYGYHGLVPGYFWGTTATVHDMVSGSTQTPCLAAKELLEKEVYPLARFKTSGHRSLSGKAISVRILCCSVSLCGETT
jgi:hypothetical protein